MAPSTLFLLSLLFFFSAADVRIDFRQIFNQPAVGQTIVLEFNSTNQRTIRLTPGLSFRISCVTVGSDHISSPWTINNSAVSLMDPSDVQSGSSQVYYYESDSHKRDLVFQNFQSNMSGNYTCTVSDDFRTLLVTEGAVTVLLNKVSAVREEASGQISLNVFLAGSPVPSAGNNLTWYFNGQVLTSELATNLSTNSVHHFRFNWYPSSNTPFVLIRGFNKAMEGNYEARVTTSAGTSFDTFYLDILSRTSACLTSSNGCVKDLEITVPTNATLTIHCADTNGDPLPTITWRKDTYSLTSANGSITITEQSQRLSSLTVTNIQPEMAGVFECVSRNQLGKTAAEAIVKVEFAPRLSRITPLISAVPVTQPIQLLVRFEGGYPDPTITWSRRVNGILMDALDDTRAELSGQHNLNLTIFNSTLEDDLQYVLTVNNSEGVKTVTFNVSVLVPPIISSTTPHTLYRRVGDCVSFVVNILNAKPPVVSTNLNWLGQYKESRRITENFVNNLSNLTVCDLTTMDSGPVRLRVNHSADNNLMIAFNLFVWNPPRPLSSIQVTGSPSCIISLSWLIVPPETEFTAAIDTVYVEQTYCPVNRTCPTDDNVWTTIGEYSTSVNETEIFLLPDKSYKFRITGSNYLIGNGSSVITSQNISTEIKGYEPRVRSLSMNANNESSITISWQTPTEINNCYTFSQYRLICTNSANTLPPIIRILNHTSSTIMSVTLDHLSPDNQYTCSVTVLLFDTSGDLTSLGITPSNVTVYTDPLPPAEPSPPSRLPGNEQPNTLQLDLTSFKRSVNSAKVSHIRLLVLRLGSTPTLPDGTPDTLYPSDSNFGTYEEVHSGVNMGYRPYVAAEFNVTNIPDQFLIGARDSVSKRKRQVSVDNGPLVARDYYTLFVRAYARSNFGFQYSIFNSTGFISPIHPVGELDPTESGTPIRNGGGSAGVAVGVVFFLLFLVAIGVAVIVVVLLVLKQKQKKRKAISLQDTSPDNIYSPPVHMSMNSLKASSPSMPLEAMSPSSQQSSPVKSPPLAATNPGYDRLDPNEETYTKPSLSPCPREESGTPSDTSSYAGSITDFVQTFHSSDLLENGVCVGGDGLMDGFRCVENVERSNFQNYLENLDSNDQHLFDRQFKGIVASSPDHPAVASVEALAAGKNRYKNVVAFDHTRVRLNERRDVPNSDYINANFIKGYHDDKLYIATQGPKKETCDDFWRMIWEQRTATIVMLTNLAENGRTKCFKYWPEEGQTQYGSIVVRVDRNIILPHYTIRGFKVFNNASLEAERTILQFHYTSWPDTNVPALASPVLDFLRAVNSANRSTDYGPIVVHCSAGVGRTGTIIALDIALEQLKAEDKVDVEGIVRFLREQRTQMVQVLPQYIFIHHAIMEDIQYGDTSILLGDFHDHYTRLQQSECTLINDEFSKIGAVKPPAQACAGPNVVTRMIESKYDPDDFTAHYLDGYWMPNLFIASPCPTAENLVNFWKLVWQERCTHVINLAPKDSTCYKYLPVELSGKEMIVGGIRIVLVGKKDIKTGYIHRTISLTSDEEPGELTVTHIQYQDWQMKHLPRSDKFAKFIQGCVLEAERPDRNSCPILIHDDDSNGAVGVFATLSYCFQRAKKERLVDLLQSVNLHYLQCPGLIDNLYLYAYCYDCLHEYTEKLLKEESVHHIYENIASFRGKLQPSPEPIDEDRKVVLSLGYDIL